MVNRTTRKTLPLFTAFWLICTASPYIAFTETIKSAEFSFEDLNRGVPRFYGLAAYYNNVRSYVVSNEELSLVDENEEITLQEGEYFASLGRKRALVILGAGNVLTISDDSIQIVEETEYISYSKEISELDSIDPVLTKLRYSHLWKPLAVLAWSIEWILVFIKNTTGLSWGLAILALALALKILLLPISLRTLRSQRKVAEYQTLLEPKIAKIKAEFKGEEAHIRIMDAHKVLGLSPLFTLKPLLSTLIQIPVLIAVFNVLGEVPNLMGSSFLWIKDLSYPDSVAQLPIVIPLLGSSFNLLPVLMTIITIVSTILFRNRHAPDGEVRRQKRNLYFMAFAFLILFYPFPASMVLYWTAANALQLLQQRIFD